VFLEPPNYRQEQCFFPCRTSVVDDGEPRGTAGAVIGCLEHLDERFLVVYGDTLFDIDIGAMLHAHEEAAAQATLLLHPNDHPADSDLVEVDEAGSILRFHAYPHSPDGILPNLVNAAFYVVERSLVSVYRDFSVPADFAKDLFPAALRDGHKLHGYRSLEYIKDLGTPSRLDKVERHLRTGVVARARRSSPQPAVFVDRDGTLNRLRDYVRTPEEFELLPGVAEAIRRLNAAEKRVVVITNQPVLARGECSFAEMRRIHAKMDTALGRHGAYLDGLYLCPHHPDGGFFGEVASLKVICDCRKPKPGLIERAITEMNIDRSASFFVGDSWRDMAAARNAGITSVLVRTGEDGQAYLRDAQFIVEDFAAAVDLILDESCQSEPLPGPEATA
jgi:histidinol-phosphate phosphatase family protein